MPVITITVVDARNNNSSPGHAFISFNNNLQPDGATEAYGFYPSIGPASLLLSVPGEVKIEDIRKYERGSTDPQTTTQVHVEVTQAQYDSIRNYVLNEKAQNGLPTARDYALRGVEYWSSNTEAGGGITNARNCITWAVEALNAGGLGVNPFQFESVFPATTVTTTINKQLTTSGIKISERGQARIIMLACCHAPPPACPP